MLEDCSDLSTAGCNGKTVFNVRPFKPIINLDGESFSDCLSGEGRCEISEPICFVRGECDGKILQVTEAIASR